MLDTVMGKGAAVKTAGRRLAIGILLGGFVLAAGICCADTLPTASTPGFPTPILVYYSLTGTTRTIAQELAANLPLETEALVSGRNRQGLFKITCVFDQRVVREDDLRPLEKDVSSCRDLIIASPVWIHRLSSPVRTFLKSSNLKGKAAWLVLTNNGNFDDEDQRNITRFVESFGIRVQGCSRVCTKAKSPNALRQAARAIAKQIAFPVQPGECSPPLK